MSISFISLLLDNNELQDEFEMNMRLLGSPTIADVVPEMVDTQSISQHVVPVPGDRLYDSNCKN